MGAIILAFIAGILVVLIPSALALIYLIKTQQTADDPSETLVIDGQAWEGEK